MRSDGGRLQLGAIISMDSDVDQHSLLIAVQNGSRLLPGARIPDESCRCPSVACDLALMLLTSHAAPVLGMPVVAHPRLPDNSFCHSSHDLPVHRCDMQ